MSVSVCVCSFYICLYWEIHGGFNKHSQLLSFGCRFGLLKGPVDLRQFLDLAMRTVVIYGHAFDNIKIHLE